MKFFLVMSLMSFSLISLAMNQDGENDSTWITCKGYILPTGFRGGEKKGGCMEVNLDYVTSTLSYKIFTPGFLSW